MDLEFLSFARILVERIAIGKDGIAWPCRDPIRGEDRDLWGPCMTSGMAKADAGTMMVLLWELRIIPFRPGSGRRPTEGGDRCRGPRRPA